jgi:hypothetical protein
MVKTMPFPYCIVTFVVSTNAHCNSESNGLINCPECCAICSVWFQILFLQILTVFICHPNKFPSRSPAISFRGWIDTDYSTLLRDSLARFFGSLLHGWVDLGREKNPDGLKHLSVLGRF